MEPVVHASPQGLGLQGRGWSRGPRMGKAVTKTGMAGRRSKERTPHHHYSHTEGRPGMVALLVFALEALQAGRM